MYTPESFLPHDTSQVHEIMRSHQFATLINQGSGPSLISHLPLMFRKDESEHGVIYGHMARANQQWRVWQKENLVTAIFHGPHAYISPRWYVGASDNVPTWNYAVAHAHGRAEIITESSKADLVISDLVEFNDPQLKLDLSERERKSFMAAIVVFRIIVENLEAKFKLSQNRTDADRKSVISNLSSSQDQAERAVSSLMRQIEGLS